LARFLDHVISLKTREDLNKLYLLAGRKRAAWVSLILYRNLINQALGVAQCQMGHVYVEVFGVHQVFHRGIVLAMVLLSCKTTTLEND
jgi:hypothetical protein